MRDLIEILLMGSERCWCEAVVSRRVNAADASDDEGAT